MSQSDQLPPPSTRRQVTLIAVRSLAMSPSWVWGSPAQRLLRHAAVVRPARLAAPWAQGLVLRARART